MKSQNRRHIILRHRSGVLWLWTILAGLLLASCSTTKRLAEDEVLYTGVKKIDIQAPDTIKLPSGLKSEVFNAVNVAPNNSLYSPYVRWPLPIGLWVWNYWKEPKKGIGKWLYNLLVSEPVLISNVQPELRTEAIKQILMDNGFFQGDAKFELLPSKKDPKKAKVSYFVKTGRFYPIDSIELLPDTCRLNHLIDSIARRSTWLKKGVRYSVDSLSNLRTDIANAMRNKGYYYFQPAYIQYLADSLITPGSIALRLTLATNTPKWALAPYKIGKITTLIKRYNGGGIPDTFETERGTVIQMTPSKLRRKLIPECISFRPGNTFSVRRMNNTQTQLAQLGIFSEININARPDTTATEPTLDIDIDCTIDRPFEVSVEANLTSKSNSYLGPGVTLGLTNKNIFGGGEQLSIKLSGGYEWQTGNKSNSLFNSWGFGLSASLAFPRLLAPNFITRRKRVLNWTRITLDGNILNRPHYFKMVQFNAGITYDWQRSRRVSNSLTLFKISYNKLLNTTQAFDSIMAENPAVALSFRNQYIPQMSYTYTYDRAWKGRQTLNFQLTLQEAGNVFWGLYRMCGVKGEKLLFGTPFSQFVKGTAQLVYGHRLSRHNIWLVSRALIGAAYAYGNSTEVPYAEQFYIGGANSIRAFAVRSLGPGSYRSAKSLANGYYDQTGTFKLELNTELRFPIVGILEGAAFIDAGNIWLLKDDPARPGGVISGKNFLRDLALGTGVGLRVNITMLVVRLDVGIPLHAPYDTGRSGYFNIPGSFWRSLAYHLAIGYPF
ncbi:MAG: BamA/TamA family outer membrane protein [Muribaculaceae bacterium]|nr:BamA/TamA family outer membrane protein [Muribaculaceae bacterium]